MGLDTTDRGRGTASPGPGSPSPPMQALGPWKAPAPSPSPADSMDGPQEPEDYSLEGLVAQRVAGVRSRTLTPLEPSGSSRRRTSSEGQYENGLEGPCSPPVRSPIRCVSPELASSIAANPGGWPKESNMHSYREAFEELEGAPVNPSGTTAARSPPGLARTPLSALGLKPHNPANTMLQSAALGHEPRSYVESVARTALAGSSVRQPQPVPHSYPVEIPGRQLSVHSYSPPVPMSYSSPLSSSSDSPFLLSRLSTDINGHGLSPPLSSLNSSLRSSSLSHPSLTESSYHNATPPGRSGLGPSGAGSAETTGRVDSPPVAHPLYPDRPAVGAVNAGGHRHESPIAPHRTVSGHTPPSPVLGRRAATIGQSPGSPGSSRHYPGNSPVQPRYKGVVSASAPATPTPSTPSLDNYLLYGFPTPAAATPPPDDRYASLSRQGSCQSYGVPGTPAFPVSPAFHGFANAAAGGSPPPPGRGSRGSPQPALPEKRRGSSGDRSLGYTGYTAVNGKAASPVSSGVSSPSGCSTPTGHLHTTADFSKLTLTDGSPETRANVKFVQDTSKYWYKPDISREQAIGLLRDRDPGAFVIRDSHSFRGAYGLALKVSAPPATPAQQSQKGDLTNELVRHFLIETSAKGVKLKGCPNEPYFGSLSALVYQHSITPLALPCKLVVPEHDPVDKIPEPTPLTNSATELLKQGAACNVLFVYSVDMESLTGPQAIGKAITETLASQPPPTATTVHFKVSSQGITLTDNQRKLFFRRHYPIGSVTFCDVDPQERRWTKSDGSSSKLFGFVARKQGSTTDNVCHLFAEMDSNQPAPAIVNFVSKVMIGWQKR